MLRVRENSTFPWLSFSGAGQLEQRHNVFIAAATIKSLTSCLINVFMCGQVAGHSVEHVQQISNLLPLPLIVKLVARIFQRIQRFWQNHQSIPGQKSISGVHRKSLNAERPPYLTQTSSRIPACTGQPHDLSTRRA